MNKLLTRTLPAIYCCILSACAIYKPNTPTNLPPKTNQPIKTESAVKTKVFISALNKKQQEIVSQANNSCQKKAINPALIKYKRAFNPNNLNASSEIYTELANCLLYSKQDELAIQAYLKALDLPHIRPDTYTGIAGAYLNQKDYASAVYYLSYYNNPNDIKSIKLKIQALLGIKASNHEPKLLDTINQKLAELDNELIQAKLYNQSQESSTALIKNTPAIIAANTQDNKPTNLQEISSNLNHENEIQQENIAQKPKTRHTSSFEKRIKRTPQGRTYIITRPYDSLYKLSLQSVVSIKRLKQINRLKNNRLALNKRIYLR